MNTIFEDYYVHHYLDNANYGSGKQRIFNLVSNLSFPMKLFKKNEMKEAK